MPTSVQIIVLGLLAVVGIISLILEIKARRPKASREKKSPLENATVRLEPADLKKTVHIGIEGKSGLSQAIESAGNAIQAFGAALSATNPTHDHGPVDKPTSAIELPPPEKPNLVTVDPPVKITPSEALTAANRNRTATARVRAEYAARDLQTGRSREETAKDAGYKSVDSMRKCMAKYGFKMPKLPKEVPNEPA